jgi:hypothetical protein
VYEAPQKADLERNLDTISERGIRDGHTARLNIVSDAIKRGAGQSSRVIIAVIIEFEKIHGKTLTEAMHLIKDIVERSAITPTELVSVARPKLEEFAKTLLAQVPDFGFPHDANRIRDEFGEKFRRAREGALRDIETGFIGGRDVSAAQKPTVLNNITVNRSVVGTINTGNVEKIDVSLTHLHHSGRDDAKDALKALTEAILGATMPEDQKGELIEQVAFLSEEAAADADKRRPALIKPVLGALTQAAGTVSAMAGAWQAAEPILRGIFGL